MSAKTGLHWLNTAPWMRRVDMPAPFVKRVSPNEEDIFPGKRTIGRVYMTDGEEGAFYSRGKAGGAAYFERCLPYYKRAPFVAAWEFVNEPAVIKTPVERAALCAATIEWARLCHACGMKVVVGNFSERNPADGTIAEFAPMLAVADYLGCHCYGAPTMQNDADRLTLRYRQLAGELSAAHVRIPPILLGETGIDMGIVGMGRKGWQKSPGLDWAGYFADLRWYEAELAKDSYIVGAFLFSAGAGKGDWRTFDISEKQAAELAAWQRAYTPQPQPQPEPPTSDPLPEHEQGDAGTLITKARWWSEEITRRMERGAYGEADTIGRSLTRLLQRAEGLL